MKTLNTFALMFCLASLAGMTACTVFPGPNTASGRPEIRVHGMTWTEVHDKILDSYTSKGFKLAVDEGSSLAFVKKVSDGVTFLKGRVKYVQVEFTIQIVGAAVDVHAICSTHEPGHLFMSNVDTTMSSSGGAHQIFLEEMFGEAGSVERPEDPSGDVVSDETKALKSTAASDRITR